MPQETTTKDSEGRVATAQCKHCGKQFSFDAEPKEVTEGVFCPVRIPPICPDCNSEKAAKDSDKSDSGWVISKCLYCDTAYDGPPVEPGYIFVCPACNDKKPKVGRADCKKCGDSFPFDREPLKLIPDICPECYKETHVCTKCGKPRPGFEPGLCGKCSRAATAKDVEAKKQVVSELLKSVCVCCDKSFEYLSSKRTSASTVNIPAMWAFKPNICQACADKQKAEQEAADKSRQEDDQAARWHAICPPLYCLTDVERLKKMHGEKVEWILNWEYGPKGLLLLGPTRTGKTRLMYKLLDRLHGEGYEMHVTSCCGLGHELLSKIKDGSDWIGWMAYLAKVPILAIDDLGKGTMTERVAMELCDMIEQRMAFQRPIIVTTNMFGEELSAHIGEDRGPPTVARLRECCESVSLTLPEKK